MPKQPDHNIGQQLSDFSVKTMRRLLKESTQLGSDQTPWRPTGMLEAAVHHRCDLLGMLSLHLFGTSHCCASRAQTLRVVLDRFCLLKMWLGMEVLVGRSIACGQAAPAWFEADQQKQQGGLL